MKNELSSKEMEENLFKKENQGLKVKVEKLMTNEKFLKEEFDCLEEEKYKLDKVVVQNIEEIKEQKNSLMKAQSQISLLQQQIEASEKEKNALHDTNQQLTV